MENYETREKDPLLTETSPGIYEVKDFYPQECQKNDQDLQQLYISVREFWEDEENEVFNKQRTPFPILMSEYTAKAVAVKANEIEKFLNPSAEEKPWNPDNSEDLYNFSILLRVNVPDTIKPITDNTWDMLKYIEKETLNETPDKKIFIRSFFTGSAVAEKELIHQMTFKGYNKWCIVTTDAKTTSTAYSALNLSILNATLPEEQKFKIILTNHQIDDEIGNLIDKHDRIIVIQKGLAEICSKYSSNLEWDALLLDNGLPYVPKNIGETIIEETLKKRNSNTGMAINILGLDSDILVDIPTTTKLKEIFSMKDLFKNYKKRFHKSSPTNYPHRYHYHKEGDIYKITKVYSYGAALLFTLIRNNLSQLGTISSLINNATGLSRAKSNVITSPVTTHYSTVDFLENNGIKYDEIMKALDPQAFGFNEERLENGERIFIDKKINTKYTEEEFYKLCKGIDPLVLRTSRFWVY